MALDPSIILAGQPVNVLGAISAGNEAAAFQNDALHQQDYRNMLAQNGAGIMAGETGALNALAGFDPAAALGVQESRLGMEAKRQSMDILSAQEKRAAEEYARGLTAEQRAAEAAAIEGAVKQGMMIPDAASWDAFMSQSAPELVGQFENRQALAAQFMGWADVLKQAFPEPVDPVKGAPSGYMWNDPGNPGAGVARIPGMDQGAGFRVASPDEAAQYGAAAGQFGPDGRFYPVNPPSGMSVETGPDGQLKIVQGPGAGGAGGLKLTEAQSKDVGYWNRMTGVSPTLDEKDTALAGLGDTVSGSIPLVGNYMTSDDYKSAWQAGQEWLSGILRKDTGAAITTQEMAIYGKMFLPVPGDGPDQIAQKRGARKRAEEGIRLGLGTAEILAQEVEARRTGAAPAASSPEPAVIPEGIDPADWEFMTPEERAMFQ